VQAGDYRVLRLSAFPSWKNEATSDERDDVPRHGWIMPAVTTCSRDRSGRA